MNEINNIIEKTPLEHDLKYDIKWASQVSIIFIVQFFDKINNKIRNITTKKTKKKTNIASKNRYELIKINTLSVKLEEKIYKKVVKTCMKFYNIPLLWRNIFLNFANNKDFVNNYCNRPLNSFDRHCREWYLHSNTEDNLDELPEHAIYFE